MKLRELFLAQQFAPAKDPGDGYTLQDLIDTKKGLDYLYCGVNPTAEDLAWLSEINLSKATSAKGMFQDCTTMTEVPQFPTYSITNMSNMFYNCTSLATPPKLNTANVTDMSAMFFYCGVLKGDMVLNTSKCTTLKNAFDGCTQKGGKLILTDTSKVTDMSGMLFARPMLSGNRGGIVRNSDVDTADNPYSLDLDISSCTTLSSAFCGYEGKAVRLRNGYNFSPDGKVDSAFQTSQLINTMHLELRTPKSTNNMFYNCYGLKTLTGIDMRNTTGTSSMFSYCYGLEHVELKNIKTALQVGSGSSWGTKLTAGCLAGLCYELCNTGSSKKLTVGTTNMTKLNNIYAKEIAITDEMLAADDLINDKLPFEAYVVDPDGTAVLTSHIKVTRVASVDELPEGAMQMSAYIAQKNWTVG